MRLSVRRSGRRGQGIIEMIFGLIMFAAMLGLVCTVCMMLYLQHALVSAAREGARAAAINTNLATTNAATGRTAVATSIQDFFRQTTGQTIAASDITVSGPTGTVGNRVVTVTVRHTMQNPLPIGGFLSAFGASNTTSLEQFPMSASTTMRYEE